MIQCYNVDGDGVKIRKSDQKKHTTMPKILGFKIILFLDISYTQLLLRFVNHTTGVTN